MSLVVYSRQGCHLCDELLEALLPLVHGQLDVDVRDIDTRDDWREAYNVRIPVVEYAGETVCEYHLDRDKILSLLRSRDSRD
ncbi:MAG: glutaredoxin family protein [Pseudomonadota bacterium]